MNFSNFSESPSASSPSSASPSSTSSTAPLSGASPSAPATASTPNPNRPLADSIAIAASNVTLTLGSPAAPVSILRGIDLTVAEGESLGLLGPSGSGKSSLMAVLAGLESATGGSVRVAGMDLSTMNEDALAHARRGRIAIVLQAFHLLPTMSALENVAVPLELAGYDSPFDRAASELKAVGLGHRLDHYPIQLSGGEQQRVAIARALAPQPTIIFADEPTGNLDAETGHEIIDLLFARQKTLRATLMIITHDSELANRCDRVLTMRDGNIVNKG